jgi:hypothetical protein
MWQFFLLKTELRSLRISEYKILLLLGLVMQEYDQYKLFQLLDTDQIIKRSSVACILVCLTSLTSHTIADKRIILVFINIVIFYIFYR